MAASVGTLSVAPLGIFVPSERITACSATLLTGTSRDLGQKVQKEEQYERCSYA